MTLITRRDVWSFTDPWDATLVWYERAVEELRKLPIDDVRSWTSLAAMHGLQRAMWESHGYIKPGQKLPDLSETLWMQCQHQTWFFLPWHRGYLKSFEAIIGETIVKLGGPPGWALPYWNYNGSKPDDIKLPIAFRDELRPDGKPNNLFVKARYGIKADGSIVGMTKQRISLAQALSEGDFTDATGGFAGPDVGFLWGDETGTVGVLEATPHGTVHVLVGSMAKPDPTSWAEIGLMRSPETAALDPIFWLHHANIDRLWEVWRLRDPANLNSDSDSWRNGPPDNGRQFLFPTPAGELYSPKVYDITHAESLSYRYDDVSDPLPEIRSERSETSSSLLSFGKAPMKTPREFASNIEGRIRLGATSGEAVVKIDHASAPPAMVQLATSHAPKRPRVYLSLESIQAPTSAQAFDVLLAAPDNTIPDIYIGTVSMFGAPLAADRNGPHGGTGLTQTFDISSAYAQLQQSPAAQTGNLTVRFRQIEDCGNLLDVTIGKVRLLHKI